MGIGVNGPSTRKAGRQNIEMSARGELCAPYLYLEKKRAGNE